MKSPFNRNMFLPLMVLASLMGGNATSSSPAVLLPPEPHSRSKGGGRGGYKPKKTDYDHRNKSRWIRPSKARRPDSRFHRTNIARNRYNIWNKQQLES